MISVLCVPCSVSPRKGWFSVIILQWAVFLLEGLKLGCNLAALVPCLPRCTWIMLTVWDKNRWAFPFLSPSPAACKQIPSCLYIVIRNKCATNQMTVGHPINCYDHSIAASVVKILGGNEWGKYQKGALLLNQCCCWSVAPTKNSSEGIRPFSQAPFDSSENKRLHKLCPINFSFPNNISFALAGATEVASQCHTSCIPEIKKIKPGDFVT